MKIYNEVNILILRHPNIKIIDLYYFCISWSQIEKKLRLNEFFIIYEENKKPTIFIVGLIF